MKKNKLLFLVAVILIAGCSSHRGEKSYTPDFHSDRAFPQEYSIKYNYETSKAELRKVVADRNGYISVLSSAGLLRPHNGKLLFPGTLESDRQYRPLSDKKISGMTLLEDQIVYVDDKAVLSNSWAGKIYFPHTLPGANLIAGSPDFSFLISDGKRLQLVSSSGIVWEGSLDGEEIRCIEYDKTSKSFIVLGKTSLNSFETVEKKLNKIIRNDDLTCFGINQDKIIAGTSNGYFEAGTKESDKEPEIRSAMPWPDLTVARNIRGNMWFGSKRGAMMLKNDGRYNYFASQRWLPSDTVTDIAEGPENSVLVLTAGGLARICSDSITLFDKANYFEKQVRHRHVRNGFNATLSGMQEGNITTGSVEDSDNDGLWTAMYLASQAFRHSVTRSDEALQNVRESLDAMERLFTVTPVPGFPARSFERRGYKYDDKAWRRADHPEWDWKSTTSSDEAIGHIFAYGVVAELVEDPAVKKQAIMLIDTLMSHILKNNFYLIDWDGQPTRWGRWNPEYVNGFPEMVGDRKLNSSNIIGMLQTAWHFTGKEKYKDAAFTLMKEYGYLKNMMKPIKEIGIAPGSADDLSRLLSEGWNHSDDEMYYCGYWGLYRYAFNDTLKAYYRKSILDHWESERPEKEGLWNIMTAMTGAEDIDLEEAIWYLREYPVDLVEWKISNSHRKDISFVDPNFRNQTVAEVLPPDELPIERHNANRFGLDGGNGGKSEMSAGDIWLLPYWMGRYLGLISGPERIKE